MGERDWWVWMEYTGIAGSGCVFARSPAAAMDNSLTISCDSSSCPTYKHFYFLAAQPLLKHNQPSDVRFSIVDIF